MTNPTESAEDRLVAAMQAIHAHIEPRYAEHPAVKAMFRSAIDAVADMVCEARFNALHLFLESHTKDCRARLLARVRGER